MDFSSNAHFLDRYDKVAQKKLSLKLTLGMILNAQEIQILFWKDLKASYKYHTEDKNCVAKHISLKSLN